MQFTDLEAKYGGFYEPHFSVRVGDRTYSGGDYLSNLSVSTTLDGADTFSFTLHSRFDRTDGEFLDIDWGSLAAGERVAVSMGYRSALEPLVAGRIQSVAPTFPSGDFPTIEVSGYGFLHDMMTGTTDRSWDETTDSAIAEAVARDYGFTERVVEETGLTHRKIIQNGQNDYRFLESLADRNGFELFAAGETFYFRAPKGDRAPRLTLRYGESLESFSPELNSGEQVAEVTVRHWDPTKGTEIVGTAKRDTGRERGGGKTGSGKRVLRVPVRSAAEADRVAEAAMARIEAGLVTGGGETVGLPEIRAGETLGLVGLGERFSSGPDAATHYYVESATHRLDDSGYRTSFEVTETTT